MDTPFLHPQPQSATSSPAAAGNSPSPINPPANRPKPQPPFNPPTTTNQQPPHPDQPPANPPAEPANRGRGRPAVLDDAKRREICALITGGCSLREAARYVGCSCNTIRRETLRNADFQARLRRAEMDAQLKPLRAMQQAAATNWRAAAWMLERAYPDHFARRNATAISPQQARRLLGDVLRIVCGEVCDPYHKERIEKRLRAAFEYTIRATCDIRRTSSSRRRAIHFGDQKDRTVYPFAPFGPALQPPATPANIAAANSDPHTPHAAPKNR